MFMEKVAPNNATYYYYANWGILFKCLGDFLGQGA